MADLPRNAALGEEGEKQVTAVLERALSGRCFRMEGRSDLGRDIHLQFASPGPKGEPLDVMIQAKTGESYAEDCGSRWRIHNLDATRFDQWRHSAMPVVLIWMHPDSAERLYWRFVTKDSSEKRFYVSKGSFVTPATRFDFAAKLHRANTALRLPAGEVQPPLGQGLRQFSKRYYVEHLLGQNVPSPLFAKVGFTWRGWRHITHQKRHPRHIKRSLELLPLAMKAVAQPGGLCDLQRVHRSKRGEWMFESRLIVFGHDLQCSGSAPTRLRTVLRESVRYPVNWRDDLQLSGSVFRHVAFESIYEKEAG